MNKYVELLRVPQWYKNLVIFLALFYTRNVFEPRLLLKGILGFAALCLASSSYYIINDIRDRKSDSKHPEKKRRPIASGEVGIAEAKVVSLLLMIVSISLAYSLKPAFAAYVLALLASSVVYTLWLENIAFVDVHVISVNFLIRAVSGAVLINVPASPWLIASVFFMALFLAIAKRKGDLILLGKNAAEHKKVYRVYDMKMLDNLLVVLTSVLLFTYIFYTFTAYESKLLMLTIPFASMILMRYLALVEDGHVIARKTQYFFKDKQLTITFILWVVSSYLILGVMQ